MFIIKLILKFLQKFRNDNGYGYEEGAPEV